MLVGLVYVAFLLLSVAGGQLRNVPLQLVANATGFVLAVLLYRLFAPADPRMALALVPLALIHWRIDGVAFVDNWAVRRRVARCSVGGSATPMKQRERTRRTRFT